jgi:hypothetical protein
MNMVKNLRLIYGDKVVHVPNQLSNPAMITYKGVEV